MRRDRTRVVENALELARLVREYDLTMFRGSAAFLEAWANAAVGAQSDGLEGMRRGVELLREQNVLWFDGMLKIVLAEAEQGAGDVDRAVALVDEGLATAERIGYRAFEAELHRVRAEMLLKRDPANPAPAEEAFLTAIAVAKQQGTRSFELRAAVSLAKLYQSTARPAEAHAVLAPALEGFSPTPEMPELSEAQALLAALGESEEVKAAIAQRERRLRLQTAYGQAMMWGKGYAAGETKAALAREAELAGRTHDLSARFTALQGQFRAACTEGELHSAREMASAFLREAEEAGRVWEAGAANAMLGLIAYWHGDFVEARTRCERALAAREASPDPKVSGRFGHGSTYASSFLAATTWQLGEVERARELINSATQRASEIGHIGAMADALFWKSYLEIWRGDPLATLSSAEALEPLAREHGMVQFVNEAELHSGWARGRINDPMAGAAQVRRVLAAFVDQGVKINGKYPPAKPGALGLEPLEAAEGVADAAPRIWSRPEAACQRQRFICSSL